MSNLTLECKADIARPTQFFMSGVPFQRTGLTLQYQLACCPSSNEITVHCTHAVHNE